MTGDQDKAMQMLKERVSLVNEMIAAGSEVMTTPTLRDLAKAARAKLHQELDELLDEWKVEEDPTFAGIQIDVLVDQTNKRLAAIRFVPVDQAEDGTLSRRIENN